MAYGALHALGSEDPCGLVSDHALPPSVFSSLTSLLYVSPPTLQDDIFQTQSSKNFSEYKYTCLLYSTINILLY